MLPSIMYAIFLDLSNHWYLVGSICQFLNKMIGNKWKERKWIPHSHQSTWTFRWRLNDSYFKFCFKSDLGNPKCRPSFSFNSSDLLTIEIVCFHDRRKFGSENNIFTNDENGKQTEYLHFIGYNIPAWVWIILNN